ncbi:MAG TPA: DUF4384 domain-containing protein [Pyrinomonadaceae bacterium]|nr:DUF4384 domain-containing protein [Pyrinomonadaceae bacterium]
MRIRSLVTMSALIALLTGVFVVSAHQDDVRGAFLESRPKTTNLKGPSRRHRRRPAKTNTNANSAANASAATNANTTTPAATNRPASKKAQPAIGLGYTIFMREPSGRAIRVEPTREFRNADRIRIALEPNTDGYLYIFNSENGAAPRMIFPDARLDAGENWIEAHVPVEVPSSEEAEERLRWFEFYGDPGTERVFIVVTREPLSGVPTADELVAFCGLNKDKCPWQAPNDVWQQIEKMTTAQVKVATTQNFGQAQTEREKVAMTRGLGLDQSMPQPSVIRISASSNEPMLVTVLDLVHK